MRSLLALAVILTASPLALSVQGQYSPSKLQGAGSSSALGWKRTLQEADQAGDSLSSSSSSSFFHPYSHHAGVSRVRREAGAMEEDPQSPKGSSQGGSQHSSPQKSPSGSQKNRFQQLTWSQAPIDVKEAVKQGATAKSIEDHLKEGLQPILFFDMKTQNRYIEFVNKGKKADFEEAAQALLQRKLANDPEFEAAVRQLRSNTRGHGLNAPFLRQPWTSKQIPLKPAKFDLQKNVESATLLNSKKLNEAGQKQTKMRRRQAPTSPPLGDITLQPSKNTRRSIHRPQEEERAKNDETKRQSHDQNFLIRRSPRETPAVYHKASSWLSNVHPQAHKWVSDKYSKLRDSFGKNGAASQKTPEQPSNPHEAPNPTEPPKKPKEEEAESPPETSSPQKGPPHQSPPGQGSARTKRRARQRKAQKERQRLAKQNGAGGGAPDPFSEQRGFWPSNGAPGGKGHEEPRIRQPDFSSHGYLPPGYRGPVYKEGSEQVIGFNKGLPADVQKKAAEDYKAQFLGKVQASQGRQMFGGFFGQGKRLDGPRQNPGHSLLRRGWGESEL